MWEHDLIKRKGNHQLRKNNSTVTIMDLIEIMLAFCTYEKSIFTFHAHRNQCTIVSLIKKSPSAFSLKFSDGANFKGTHQYFISDKRTDLFYSIWGSFMICLWFNEGVMVVKETIITGNNHVHFKWVKQCNSVSKICKSML